MSSPAASPIRPLDLCSALLVVVLWGVNFVVMKWGLRTFTPFQLGAVRFLCAALPLVFFIRPPKVDWHHVVLFGLLQGLGQFGFLFTALRVGMTASLGSVILQTQVFFTALWTLVLLHERPSRPLYAGMGIAALGLACFVMNELQTSRAGHTSLLGLLLVLCAAASWAGSNVMVRLAQRRNATYHPIAFIAWSSLASVLPFAVMSILFDGDTARWLHAATWRAMPWLTWVSVAYLGWVSTIIGYGLWTRLIQRYSANRIAPFSLCVPIVGLSSGMLVLGEPVTGWQWAGSVLVVMALVVVIWGGKILARMR